MLRNFRDLSYLGLKKGMLCRSDLLFKLTHKEKKFLKKEHNIKIVIDLRRGDECKRTKDTRMLFVKHLHIPLAANEIKMVQIKHMTLPDMYSFYREMVEPSKKESWVKLFNLLLADNKKGILYHCSSGKDRTGVLTAVILTVLGFDKETIYNDYLLTNQNPLYYKEIVKSMDEESRNIILDHSEAKKDYLDTTFNEIDKLYGSMDNFLKDICLLDEEKIEKLKEKYLDPDTIIKDAVNTPTSEFVKKAPWDNK